MATGTGVLVDAAAPTRIMFYNQAVADAQDDGLGNYEYDLHKLWACMGRNDVNGLMRSGFVEEGDAASGAPAGWIEPFVAGVPVPDATLATTANGTKLLISGGLFGAVAAGMYLSGPGVPAGTYVREVIDANNLVTNNAVVAGAEPQNRLFFENRWGSLLPYNPLGGIGAGDYCLFGALRRPTGIALHLLASLGAQPAVTVNYWNGAAWAAATVTRTPDFTRANGKSLQRLEITLPTNFAKATLGNAPRAYYFIQLLLPGAIAAAPSANAGYRDWLYGYMKHFYIGADFKRGDDGTGNSPTDFRHTDPHTLRFEDGRGPSSRTQLTTKYQIGSRSVRGAQFTSDWPWVWVASVYGIIRGIQCYGGAMIGVWSGTGANAPTFRGNASLQDGCLQDMMFAGFNDGLTVGESGSAAMMQAQDILFRRTPGGASAQSLFRSFNMDATNGRSKNIKAAGLGNEASFIVTSVGTLRVEGVRFVGEAVTTAQMHFTGAGYKTLVDIGWSEASPKVYGGSSTSPPQNFRRLSIQVFDKAGVPLPGVAVRVTGSDGVKQGDTVTDAQGLADYISTRPGAPAVGIQNRRIFATSVWVNDVDRTLESEIDSPALIEINPPGHASYNPAFESLLWRGTFQHPIEYNASLATYEEVAYNKVDMVVAVSLGPPAAPAPLPAPVLAADLPLAGPGEIRYEGPVAEVR